MLTNHSDSCLLNDEYLTVIVIPRKCFRFFFRVHTVRGVCIQQLGSHLMAPEGFSLHDNAFQYMLPSGFSLVAFGMRHSDTLRRKEGILQLIFILILTDYLWDLFTGGQCGSFSWDNRWRTRRCHKCGSAR